MIPLYFSILAYFQIEHCRRFGYNEALLHLSRRCVMKKYTAEELAEALDIYMGLCEEFPELYNKYVEKV